MSARLCVFVCVSLFVSLSVRAGLETKVLLRETYEKYPIGQVPLGTAGTSAEKGATIAVSADAASKGTKSLKFADAPGLDRSFYPFLEKRFSNAKLAQSGTVSFSVDIMNSTDFPAKFDIEFRDWTQGAYTSMPKLTILPDGSLSANGRPTEVKVGKGRWYSIALNFSLDGDDADTPYQGTVTDDAGSTAPFVGAFSGKAKKLSWLGIVPYNDSKAIFYVDNLTLVNEREAKTVAPHELYTDYIMRGDLSRSHARFSKGGPVRVAFMGGSVTTRQWREPVMDYLAERYPEADFDFVMAGIGGTNADLGAFRLPEHVFGRGKVDLFFLEFAVNGGGVRAMEGIVRQARRRNPDIDIVIMYFASKGHCNAFNKSEIPGIVQNHEKVADAYGIPALYLYREIARRIKDGRIKWEDFSGDSVHPNQAGCDMYAQCITDFLAKELKGNGAVQDAPRPVPEKLDPLCYENGRFVPLEDAVIKTGFERILKWTCKKTCNFRPPVDVLACTEPGSELSLDFEGKAVGIYTIIGMDAGIIEFSIDGGEFREADQFDHYCPRFHRPQHKIFVDNLVEGKHTITIRSSAKKNEKSEGYAIRILKFMVN